MSFFEELRRRNVFKVAAAYIIVGWLIMQAGEVLSPALRLPEWVNSALAFFLILGFPLAIFFAWAFEITPEGLKKEKDVDRSKSITTATGKKLNHTITIVLVLALALFAYDKFVLDPDRDAAEIATAVQDAQDQATPAVATEETDNSIAVLPFVNMSSDQEQEYFSDGLSEELLNLLAKIPELRVAARTSSFSFKDQNLEIPEIASRLKVAHVLEGSVRKSGNQIRITAQLIQADNGYHLWSETYDRELDNIFQIQDEIALAVVDALKITLLGEAPKVRETDPEAYQLFLEGQHFRRQVSGDSLPKAIDLFKKALDIDPRYVPAWAELGYTYLWSAGTDDRVSIEEGNKLADHAIEMAISIDPNHAFSYFVRGSSRIHNKFKFKDGAEDFQRASALEPGNAFLIGSTGTGARVTGQFDLAIERYQQSLSMDPVVPEFLNWLGLSYIATGRFDEAETAYQKALAISPQFAGMHYRIGRTLLAKGDLPVALAEMEKETHAIYEPTGLAMVHHALGNEIESQRALDHLVETGADDAAFQIAEVYGYRGEVDKAFEWLEQSLVIKDSGLASVLGDNAFLSLRTDPRWQPFLEKLGLLEYWLKMPEEYGGPLQ
jgi:TolB-like protein/Tfp pilus assembly protein PilF